MGQDVRELLRRDVTPELYAAIRDEWKRHSLAEDSRDIPGLLATLTEDCVYEIPQRGRTWRGHEGAAAFYRELLAAFPDLKFELTTIVIGPQGVCEEALATGTQREPWLDMPASGEPVRFRVVIFFPWDLERAKFTGERVYFDLLDGPAR